MKKNLDQNNFFTLYRIDPEAFEKTGLIWKELCEIIAFYYEYMVEYQLKENAQQLLNEFLPIEHVHSGRYRIKNPEHLIEKIIRKKIEDPARNINIDNFTQEITDLTGIRILHLFKSNWKDINGFIKNKYDPLEIKLLYREGDFEQNIFEEYQSEEPKIITEKHSFGYRSIHYIISYPRAEVDKRIIIEIQMRTIFEEAWSEIDHVLRYPYYMNNIELSNSLKVLNRVAGLADEMSALIQERKKEIEKPASNKFIKLHQSFKNLESNFYRKPQNLNESEFIK
jgi:putative GTP pyrophosphokinase